MGQQLSEITTQNLIREIKEGRFSKCEMLPPEDELSEIMGVSRSVIRVCLTQMEDDGWVTRKHGVGTIINRYIAEIKSRLDISLEFTKAIEASGKRAMAEVLEVCWMNSDEELCNSLKISCGERVLKVRTRVMANGRPAVYCEDYIPERIVINKDVSEESTTSIYDFLERNCRDADIENFVTEIRALPVTHDAAEAMQVPESCVMLYFAETGYNLKAVPCIYSREYFWDNAIEHYVVRKMR